LCKSSTLPFRAYFFFVLAVFSCLLAGIETLSNDRDNYKVIYTGFVSSFNLRRLSDASISLPADFTNEAH
jgi:hypothetical protein